MRGRWQTVLGDGRVQCDLCPRHCRLREGQRGYCFVRQGAGDHIDLTTWGRSSGFAVDPIEKKPLSHFYPGTPILSFGTAGCNLGCKFCQNWEISTAREWDRLSAQATPEMLARWCVDNDVPAVAFTYNDPIIFAEYAIDVAAACHEVGVRTVAVTAGWISRAACADFFDAMDATNIDLKGFDPDFYRRVTGARLDDVLETIEWVLERGRAWVELTTLVIPGLNDSEADLRAQFGWIMSRLGPDVPLHLSAFHPAHKMTDRPRTPPETLRWARDLALEAGLHFVYTGNIYDPAGDVTSCPGCGAAVIERDRFRLLAYRLDEAGQCARCQRGIPGRFGSGPGEWGPNSYRMAL